VIRTQKIALNQGEWASWYVHRDHAFCDQTHVAKSHALFCPSCQEIWAILHFVDEREIWPVAQFCEHCRPSRDDYTWYPVAGSILVEEGYGVVDDSLLAGLPPELIKREFDLHIKAYT